MKIAMVSANASPLTAADGASGGQSVHVAELARELGGQGHQVIVYTHRHDPELRDRVRLAPDVTIEHVPAGPARHLSDQELAAHIPEFGRYLANRWDSVQPDVIHAHSWLSGLAALTAAGRVDALGATGRREAGSGQGIPIVQGFDGLAGRAQARRKLEIALARTAAAVITGGSTEAAALMHAGVPRRVICVVPEGVDVDRFTPDGPSYARSEALRLLSLNLPAKAIETTTAALTRIPRAEFVVAGGPLREDLDSDPQVHRLRTVAKRAGVADRVTFIGQVIRKDLPRLLRSADLVMCVPPDGPADRVPLEAMACGVPVVITPAGGPAEMVIDKVTGLHVPGGHPAEMARRVRELLADSTLRSAYGIAAADRARSRYSWERIGQETLSVYERVTSSQEQPTRHSEPDASANAELDQ